MGVIIDTLKPTIKKYERTIEDLEAVAKAKGTALLRINELPNNEEVDSEANFGVPVRLLLQVIDDSRGEKTGGSTVILFVNPNDVCPEKRTILRINDLLELAEVCNRVSKHGCMCSRLNTSIVLPMFSICSENARLPAHRKQWYGDCK